MLKPDIQKVLELKSRESEMKYKRLKVVELRGFCGSETDVELATYILSESPFLEKIIVDPRKSSEFKFRLEPNSEDEILQSKNVALQLATRLSPAAQLLIL